MKFFKLLFSRAFLTILAFLAQLGLIVAVIWLFKEWYALFQAVSLIVGIIAFFSLVNKKEPTEYKLAWAVVLFVLPVVGTVFYLLYSGPKLKKKDAATLDKFYKDTVKLLPSDSMAEEKDGADYSDYMGISKYLFNTSGVTGAYGNRAEFLPSGEAFFADLKEELKKAKKFVFIQFFIIHNGKMWGEIKEILLKKLREGVEVRIMYDDLGSFGNPPDFKRKLKKQGFNCVMFNPLGPTASGKYNNRDHRKVVVIDGVTAFTGGANLSDEYINEKQRFGKWKDSAIKIKGSAVKVFTMNFLFLFDVSSGRKSEYINFLGVKSSKFTDAGYVQPFFDGPKPLYEEAIAENNFLNLIGVAKQKLYITTPYLIPDYSLILAIRNAALRGVDVRIITPHIPDKKLIFSVTRSNYKFLTEAGVKIYEYTPGFIHSKQLLVDDKAAFVGTVNLDYRSLVHHFECGVNLYNADCIKDIAKDFEEVVSESELIDPKKIKRGFITRIITSFMNLFQPML